jgi:hypothetical protein
MIVCVCVCVCMCVCVCVCVMFVCVYENKPTYADTATDAVAHMRCTSHYSQLCCSSVAGRMRLHTFVCMCVFEMHVCTKTSALVFKQARSFSEKETDTNHKNTHRNRERHTPGSHTHTHAHTHTDRNSDSRSSLSLSLR